MRATDKMARGARVPSWPHHRYNPMELVCYRDVGRNLEPLLASLGMRRSKIHRTRSGPSSGCRKFLVGVLGLSDARSKMRKSSPRLRDTLSCVVIHEGHSSVPCWDALVLPHSARFSPGGVVTGCGTTAGPKTIALSRTKAISSHLLFSCKGYRFPRLLYI